MNISATGVINGLTFYLNHYWGRGKASVGFDSSQRVTVITFFSNVFDRTLLILAGNDYMHGSLDEFEIWPDATTGFHGNR